ncbi:MAG: O-antigen ligase family protein [Smithella sp.]
MNLNQHDQISNIIKHHDIYDILEHIIPILIGLFILIIPFPYNTAAQEISFYLSVTIIIFLIICKRTIFSFKSPFTVPFILFCFWVLLCIPFALNKGNSFHDFYAHLIKYLVIFYILSTYFVSKRLFVVLCWIIVISITFFSFGGTIYYYVIKGASLRDRFGLPEIGVDINHIGFLAAPTLFITIALFVGSSVVKKLFLFLSMISTISAIVLSGTKGALLGLIIPITFLFMKYKKITIVTLLCLLLLIMIAPFKSKLHVQVLQDSVTAEVEKNRFSIWHAYLKTIKEHPVGGIGYGMQSYNRDFFIKNNFIVPNISESKDGKAFFMPHNTLIDLAVRTGIVGVCFFLYCLYTFFKIGWLLYKNMNDDFIKNWTLCLMACCLSLLIQGMFVDLMIGIQIIYLFVFFAMMNILWRIKTTDNNLHDL